MNINIKSHHPTSLCSFAIPKSGKRTSNPQSSFFKVQVLHMLLVFHPLIIDYSLLNLYVNLFCFFTYLGIRLAS